MVWKASRLHIIPYPNIKRLYQTNHFKCLEWEKFFGTDCNVIGLWLLIKMCSTFNQMDR